PPLPHPLIHYIAILTFPGLLLVSRHQQAPRERGRDRGEELRVDRKWRRRRSARTSSTSPSSQSKPSATTVCVCFPLISIPRVPTSSHGEGFRRPSIRSVLLVAEMVDAMKKVAKLDVELTVEERNLLSVGYKNVVGSRRASWRILSSIEQKEESRGNEHHVKNIKEYLQKVELELANICTDIITLIDEHLIPSSTAGESSVFYYKM
ncbi:hypothetical protein BHE74_00041739, partial [Ensete ventricosum]